MPTALETAQAKRIRDLEKENKDLRSLVQRLEARIRILEEALQLKGRPLPPGEKPDAPAPTRKKRRKKRGRKKGHPGTSRKAPLVPDRVVDLFLHACPR